jgi:TetR/AcrR family transcriptional repressor of bet genes
MPGRKASEATRRSQILQAASDVAERRGLAALTVRHVAKRAGLSVGLVLFHFETKDALIIAVLDHLLATTTVLHMTDDIAAISSPRERLLALLRREMWRLSSEPRRIRLFFDFWALGFRHRRIRAKMQAELDRYREAFRPIADEVLRAEPARFAGVTADGLAAVSVSFIKGCAVQSMIDPKNVDIDGFLSATQSLFGEAPMDHALSSAQFQ